MDGIDADQLVSLAEKRAWVPLAALVISTTTRLIKSDTKLPINIPARWRIWLVIGLGLASAVLEKVALGKTWTSALVGGAVSVGLAVLGHETIIASLRAGKEIPVPGLMIEGARPSPGAPVTVPPPPLEPIDPKVTPVVVFDPPPPDDSA